MTDVLDRLRRADPCPAQIEYPPATVDRNIALILGQPTPPATAEHVELTTVRTGGRRRAARPVLLSAAAAALAVVVVALAVGISRPDRSAAPPGPSSTWVQFTSSDTGVGFQHPANWTPYPYTVVSTQTFLVTYLSTQPLAEPCSTTTASTFVEVSCAPPPVDLSRGGVFVDWTRASILASNPLAGQPGQPTTVAGRPAKLDETGIPDECRGTGAVRGVHAAITDSAAGSSDLLMMTACLGPGSIDSSLAAVRRMLSTLTMNR